MTYRPYEVGNIKRYGAIGDGATDDTVAIQAAVDAVYAQGGGDVIVPAGDYLVTSVSRVWTGEEPVNIRGEGIGATIFRKTGVTSTPIFDFSAASAKTPYFEMSGFQIIGNAKGHDGIKLTLLARLELSRVAITGCDVGLNSVGSLVFGLHECTINSNNVGFKCRKSGSTYPNLVQFYGGHFISNTTHAMDIGESGAAHCYGTDFELNGTTADTATGAIVIRSTVDDEFALSNMTFNNCWFESNYGMTLKAEAATGLMLSLKDTYLLSSESGNAADVGAIKHLHLENVMAGTVGDTVISAATRTTMIGGIIHTYTDNSNTTKINHQDSSTFHEMTIPLMRILERAASNSDRAGYGQLWVKNTTPCELWFTDDAGTDTQIV